MPKLHKGAEPGQYFHDQGWRIERADAVGYRGRDGSEVEYNYSVWVTISPTGREVAEDDTLAQAKARLARELRNVST
jgi:hypothetical protein